MNIRQMRCILFLLVGLSSCKKDDTATGCGIGYITATVVAGRNGCITNGYLLQVEGGEMLPPDDLPVNFQQAGLKVCVRYTVYEDLRMCACCGGARLTIQDIKIK